MQWVKRRHYDSMPSNQPHRDGWISVRRSSAWAEIHPHLLLTNPRDNHTGLIRFDKLMAHSLYGVHIGAGRDSGYHLGDRNLKPGFISDCFEDLVALGLPRKPERDRERLKTACAIVVAKDSTTFTPRRRDWEQEVREADPAQRRLSNFDNIPYTAPTGSSGCLSEVSDIFLLVANCLSPMDRRSTTHTERIVTFLVEELERYDNALAGMSIELKGRRLLQLLCQAPTPSFIDPQVYDSVGEIYAAVGARVKWSLGTDAEKERVMMAHALHLTSDKELPRLRQVLTDGPHPVVTNRHAAELLQRMARLIKSSAFEHKHLTLSTYGAVRRVEALLHQERGLLERQTVRVLSPDKRVAMLEKKQAMTEAAWRGSSPSNQTGTGHSGFPREMLDSLNQQVSTAEALELEDELEQMLKTSAAGYEMELCYCITKARNSVMLKVLLGNIPWLSVRPIFGQIISRVRPVWNSFATLVLIAGIEGWRTANDKQRSFELPDSVLDEVRNDSQRVSIINDIYAPMAKKVLKSAKAVPKVATEQLTNEFLLSKERQIGDRMFWLLGYKAESEAESDDEMVDSFAAVVDTLSSFLEAGAPLVGDREASHVRLAENFYAKARKEHQRAHKLWADSRDPAHKHPCRWIPANAACKAAISANTTRLDKLLDILDYAPELLQSTASLH